MSDDPIDLDECGSCGEDGTEINECPKSKRPCGHHCNCSWTQDACCWCGATFDEPTNSNEGEIMQTTTAGLAISHAAIAKPPLHIPNANGDPYKTEFVVERSPERTVKINWWHAPDDDRAPHNHPWCHTEESAEAAGDAYLVGVAFVSEVLHGGITHRVYRVGARHLGGGVVEQLTERTETIRAGQSYCVRHDEYHVVTHVERGTVTRMTTGPAVAGNAWGYLGLATLSITPATPDPYFMERLRANNRFVP